MKFRRQRREEVGINLTPLIDVVFLLLIFFMISTTFVEKPGLKIDLPDSSAQQLKNENKEVQIYLTADGDIYYDRRPVTLSTLAGKFADLGPVAEKMTFLLMADQDALHGKVIQLMDLAKTAGFGNLAIATDKPDLQPGNTIEDLNE